MVVLVHIHGMFGGYLLLVFVFAMHSRRCQRLATKGQQQQHYKHRTGDKRSHEFNPGVKRIPAILRSRGISFKARRVSGVDQKLLAADASGCAGVSRALPAPLSVLISGAK